MSVETAEATMGTLDSLKSLLPMVFIFAIFYFFLIRPQVKRQRQAQQMVNELKKGDKVVAAGGLYGVISKIEDNLIYLEIAEGVRIKALKSSVTEVLSGSTPPEAAKEVKEVKEIKDVKQVKKTVAEKPKKKLKKKD